MHSLEYIRALNDAVVQKSKECLARIERTDDVETLKKWLRKATNRYYSRTTCGNCGRRII